MGRGRLLCGPQGVLCRCGEGRGVVGCSRLVLHLFRFLRPQVRWELAGRRGGSGSPGAVRVRFGLQLPRWRRLRWHLLLVLLAWLLLVRLLRWVVVLRLLLLPLLP